MQTVELDSLIALIRHFAQVFAQIGIALLDAAREFLSQPEISEAIPSFIEAMEQRGMWAPPSTQG